MPTYDLTVIGTGPGGYVCAIRAAQLGMKVAVVEKDKTFGGTCLNVGCIPSKALLQSSENYDHAAHAFAEHGIGISGLTIDVKRMLARKDKVVQQNNDGILYLFKKNKVTPLHGLASFAGRDGDGWTLKIDGPDAGEISAAHVIIATGSKPRALPGAPFDNDRILDNEGALAMPDVPQRLGVVGAGVVGIEMGSVWRRLGSTVTMLEAVSLTP